MNENPPNSSGTPSRRRRLLAVIFILVGALFIINICTWFLWGRSGEQFLTLPYETVADMQLEYLVVYGDAANPKETVSRRERERLCPDVRKIFYANEVPFTFYNVDAGHDWYVSRTNRGNAKGVHVRTLSKGVLPTVQSVTWEISGRGNFGNGLELTYVWLFGQWIRVWSDVTWLS